MRLALAGPEDLAGIRDAERLAQTIDTFAGWVAQARTAFREQLEAQEAEAA